MDEKETLTVSKEFIEDLLTYYFYGKKIEYLNNHYYAGKKYGWLPYKEEPRQRSLLCS